MLTIGKSLETIKTKRCGVIPYCIVPKNSVNNNELWFLMARHRDTGELGDLGGGVKQLETALDAGLREFHEESRHIFVDPAGTVAPINTVLSAITLIDRDDMAIIFLPIDIKWLVMAADKFSQTTPIKKAWNEISEVVWVSQDTLTELIFSNPYDTTASKEIDSIQTDVLWKRIKIFMQKAFRSRQKVYQCLTNYARVSLYSRATKMVC